MYIYQIHSDGSALRRWKLGDTPLVVGRDAGVTVRIPDYRMSARHFTIFPERGGFVLEDIDSKNGTWINGVRIRRARLNTGDLIVAGHTHFSFEAGLMTMIHDLEKRGIPDNLASAFESLER